jgi:hypothetical protein
MIWGSLNKLSKERERGKVVRLLRFFKFSNWSREKEIFYFLMAWDFLFPKESTSRTSLTLLKVRGDSISELEGSL